MSDMLECEEYNFKLKTQEYYDDERKIKCYNSKYCNDCRYTYKYVKPTSFWKNEM